MMKNMLTLIFEPTEAWWRIKHRGKLWQVPVLLFAAVLMRFASIYLTSYPLNGTDPEKTNMMIEIMLVLVPVASWALSGYLVTSVMDGQTDLDQFLISTCYALTPMIVTTLPVILLSQLLSTSTAGFYNLVNGLIVLWTAVLLLKQLSAMNDYTFGQSLWRALIILAGIAVIWFVCFTLYVLTMNIVDFVETIWLETQLITSA